jgi:hypothetical protein
MYTLSTLLERLPNVSQARLISSGYGLWMVWQGSFNNAIGHTLRDHGLVQLVEDPCQSFWLSFNTEVFRALAKLQIWSKLNPLPLFCQVVPVTALVGYDLSLGVSVTRELARQQASVAADLEVLVHPKFQEHVRNVNGLSLGPVATMQGLASSGWMPLVSDQGLNYDSPADWYGIIKPLGRLGEREAIAGWRAFFSEVQEVFQRLSIKYLSDDAQGFVIFPLENYRQLRLYCTEISTLAAQQKASQHAYWPCVFAIMDQKGMSFSTDLPNRFGLDWNRLTPDFLHMHYRLGFSLFDAFKVNEVSYGGEQESLDSWCNVSMRQGEGQAGQGAIEMPLPRRWLAGTGNECFYCGLKSHTPAQCPSRLLPGFRGDVWRELGRVDVADMAQGFKDLDEPIEGQSVLDQARSLLAPQKNDKNGQNGKNGKDNKVVQSLLARALFSVDAPCQPWLLPVLPRIKNREWPVEQDQLNPEEPWALSDAYATFREGDLERAKEQVRAVSAKQGRSFEGACLEGFIALEAGDPHMANFYWQEAGRIGQSNIQQCYVQFLQARLHEVEGEFREALGLYRQVRSGSSKWMEPVYREGVCMVKMGFTGQSLEVFSDLVARDALSFNRILVDTEIGRGRVHVLSGLWDPWRDAQVRAQDVAMRVKALLKELPEWFEEDHDFRKPAMDHLQRMDALGGTDNFVAFRELVRGMDGFQAEMQKQIDEEIKRIKERAQTYAQRLREVQYEAGWFPFPKLLRDFNRDFNFCVKRINWIMTSQLRTAANFRAARRHVPELEERLTQLSKRLVSLRIVRDSTLFAMLMGKNFIWMEVVGLTLALLTVPVLLYYSSKVANNWIVEGILAQKWAFQKGLIFLVTVVSLGLASLKSVMSFEKKRNQLFDADASRRGAPTSKSGKGGKNPAKAPAKAAPAAAPKAIEAKAGAKPAAKPAAKAPAKPAAKGGRK